MFCGNVLGTDVRVVGDEVDAVALCRSRLIPVIAKEPAGEPHGLDRLSGRDLGDDAPIAGQHDLVPEFLHRLGWLADAYGRADLRGVAAIARGEFHVDDIPL